MNARGFMEIRGRFAGALVMPAVQTANVPRVPDGATQVKISGGDANGYGNANAVFDPDSSLTALTTNAKRWIRPGWIIKLASAGTGGARVRGRIQLFRS